MSNKILITGGTGSFGNQFIKKIIDDSQYSEIRIFSRDEKKQYEMRKNFSNEKINFFIGDVRDEDSIKDAMKDIDYVFHAAALKQVPSCEFFPMEAVKTNVLGINNLIDLAIKHNVKKIIALSTDKASSPANLYGATKLASDKLFIAVNSYSGEQNTSFSVVRYGNVMGSRGSVIPFFLSKKKEDSLPITDPRMTRFMITLEQGVELVWQAFDDMLGGEIYVKKIPSMKIVDF